MSVGNVKLFHVNRLMHQQLSQAPICGCKTVRCKCLKNEKVSTLYVNTLTQPTCRRPQSFDYNQLPTNFSWAFLMSEIEKIAITDTTSRHGSG